jgi:hypothetical protein
MRAKWQALYLRFLSHIHRKSSERHYAAIRARQPVLAPSLCVDELIFRQQGSGGDPAERNAVLRALVIEAQADMASSELAANILILALWPGLDAVHGRLCRDFQPERDDVSGEIIGHLGLGIRRLDLTRVTRIAATLIMNTERDIRRAFIRDRNRRKAQICCDDVAGNLFVALDTHDDGKLSAAQWRERLEPLLGRDTSFFLRIMLLGETQAEAGRALGLSPDAARKRHQRALARLPSPEEYLMACPIPAGQLAFVPHEAADLPLEGGRHGKD